MEEQIISFETAKLAKKKGFNIIPKYGNEASLFDKTGNHTMYVNYGFMYSGLNDGYISAPTQSLLQKWFWEKHDIWIEIVLDFNYGYIDYVIKRENNKGKYYTAKRSNYGGNGQFSSPEDALEEGLYHALLLL